MTESDMLAAEVQIPALASRAFQHARDQALALGGSVLEVREGLLVRTFADGSQQIIRSLPPLVPVRIGLKRRRSGVV